MVDGGVSYTWDSRDRIHTRTARSEDPELFRYEGTGIDPVEVGDTERGTTDEDTTVSVAGEAVTVDGHGDVVAATGPGGTTTTGSFDPWGRPESAPVGGPFGFQSDYTDPDSGTVWMGARTYDPSTAAFTSRDTWAGIDTNPVTLNRYTYANTDPLNHRDPNGHWALPSPPETDAAWIANVEQNMSPGRGQQASLLMLNTIGADGLVEVAKRGLAYISFMMPHLQQHPALRLLVGVSAIAVAVAIVTIVAQFVRIGGEGASGREQANVDDPPLVDLQPAIPQPGTTTTVPNEQESDALPQPDSGGTGHPPGEIPVDDPDCWLTSGYAYPGLDPNVDVSAGLNAPNPTFRYTYTQHVMNGWLKTQFISVTWKESVALNKYADSDPKRVIGIDLSKVQGEVLDLSRPEFHRKYLKHKLARNRANADAEILIKGHIPASAISRA